MKKHEFANALRRCGMNYATFAILVEYDQDSISRWGKNGEDVPRWAGLLIGLIIERGGPRGMFEGR